MVKTQVSSQIKVRDLSGTNVAIAPSEHSGWAEARAELMSEAKASLRSRLEARLAQIGTDNPAEVRAEFAKEEAAIEHKVDHTVHTITATLKFDYNFLSR
jgi:DNA-directed RNA polymerase subunit F